MIKSTAYPYGLEQARIRLLDEGIWGLSDGRSIPYSDGEASERYLTSVLSAAHDLSSTSEELERSMVDWTSEYHLTTKRTQLLRGFEFSGEERVLEVGAGCGAITRFLGEHFASVTAVEGALPRARIARLRTRDLPNVSVLCAPFQALEFTEKFDVVFCIGVLEYAGAFVDAKDPYDAFIERMSAALAPTGRLILAIENQFGIKYFSSSREDHTNRMFEGIEGYPRFGSDVRTFGREELRRRLARHFHGIEFYYPYPDYKIPDVIVSEEFLSMKNSARLISNSPSRDYGFPSAPLFDERAASRELERNGVLPFFANSFLVSAGRELAAPLPFPNLAIMFSSGRKRQFAAMTRVRRDDTGGVVVDKRRRFPEATAPSELTSLRFVPSNGSWQHGDSLADQIATAITQGRAGDKSTFDVCRQWLEALASSAEGATERCVPGRYLDATWDNAFISPSGCQFVDLEWEWHERIALEVLFVRALMMFLARLPDPIRRRALAGVRGARGLAVELGARFGLNIDGDHFRRYIEMEHAIVASVSPGGATLSRRTLLWSLMNSSVAYSGLLAGRAVAERVGFHVARATRVARRLARV